MPLFGKTPIPPDPSGAFALNRWILNIDGHTIPLDMNDESNLTTWIDVARSQANPGLAGIEWSGRTDPTGIGRVIGERTLRSAREAFADNPAALAQLDVEEMDWRDGDIKYPLTHYMNAEILDIAPRPIGGSMPEDGNGVGSFVLLLTPEQGAWMGNTDQQMVEHKITSVESIEAMRDDVDILTTKLESLMSGHFRELRGSLESIRNEIERLATGETLGYDIHSSEALNECNRMIDLLRAVTAVLCNNNTSSECLEIVALIRRLDRRLQIVIDSISDGVWTEVKV